MPFRTTLASAVRTTRTRVVVGAVAAVTMVAGLLVALPARQASAAPMLPSGFVLQDTFTGMRPPNGGDPGDRLTDFAFLPDESALAIGKFGKVTWVPRQGTPRQIANLPTNGTADLGLVGLAVAPDYRTTRNVYTARAISSSEPGSGTFGILRLSRWTVTVDTAGTPTGLTAEQTVLQTPAHGNAHAMTGVIAATDGTLWLSIGDLSDHRFVDRRALACSDLGDIRCKLLHLRTDGSGVPSNPFYDPANPRAIRSLVYASGLRSPFRFSLEPGTGRPVLGDVGWNTTEEVDIITPGNHYGWPCWEANAPTPGYHDLPECATSTTATPIWSYPRTGGSSVTGGVVYTGTTYPAQYRGRYFFGDYTSNRLWTMAFNQQGELTTPPESNGFGNDIGFPVRFETMPSGGDIVYADIVAGTLRRLVYAPGNNPPTAVIKTTGTPATRTVTFDARSSFDPNGDPLTYAWDFGDGTTGTGAQVSHTYPASPTSFAARLTATDPLNATGTATKTVHPANNAPTLTVQAPDPNRTFAAGEVITASATATDQEDGQLAVSWSALTVHCRGVGNCHDHPGEQQQGPTFRMTFEGHPGDTRLEISAIATDSKGATTTQTFVVKPKQRRITIQSNTPAGFTIGDEQTNSGLFTVGTTLPIIAPASALDGVANFDRWSDGNQNRVRNLTLPDADQTLTAGYRTPIDQRYATDAAVRALLGTATNVEQGNSTVRWREYTGGRLYWAPQAGVHEVHGDLLRVYLTLGGHLRFGAPTTDETLAADGTGRYNRFQRGSVYWYPGLGAWSVEGDINTKYLALGAERSVLSYPTTHQTPTQDGVGRYNHFKGGVVYWNPRTRRKEYFQGASIYWHPSTGAFETHGPIRQKWAALGWERSYLGYPTSDEFAITNGRRSNFQHGYIVYDFATGEVRDFRN